MENAPGLVGELRDLQRRVAVMEDQLEQDRLNALLPLPPRFYAVVRGRHPGLYTTAQEANAETLGFHNAMQRMFHTMAEASAFLAAHADQPPAQQPVYAVARGRLPGVYASHQQANEQTLGFPNSFQRRCNTMEEALAFIAEHRDPAPPANPLFVMDFGPDQDADDGGGVMND
jgi:viroplasmin and RNaseH domain-containing protein